MVSLPRLHGLDYLRGLSAFGIMIFHFLSSEGVWHSTESFIRRFGYYGVSLFYILSGLTLFLVYSNRTFADKHTVRLFFYKRILRIFPLLWFVTLVTFALSKSSISLTDLFLNLTGLFGFVKWDGAIAPVAWSIGNELVFYSLFPLLLFFLEKNTTAFLIAILVTFGLYAYFSFELIDIASIDRATRNYMNPSNQAFLFVSGILIGHLYTAKKIAPWLLLLTFGMGLAIFTLYPVTGDRMELVTGTNRLVFTMACLLMTLFFFKYPFQLPRYIHQVLAALGAMSYSLYLLHPLVYWGIVGLLRKFTLYPLIPESVRWLLVVSASLFISYFSHRYFEKYFITIGNKKRNRPLSERAFAPKDGDTIVYATKD